MNAPFRKWLVMKKLARKDWVDVTTPISNAPDILSIKQAAKLLGVHKDTIRGAIGRGELPIGRMGARVLIQKKTLLAAFSKGNQPRPTRVVVGEGPHSPRERL